MRNLFFAVCLIWVGIVSHALGSPFGLGPNVQNLAVARGYQHADLLVPILPMVVSGFAFEEVAVSSNSAWLLPTLDTAAQRLVLKFDTAALAVAEHTATVTVQHGTDVVSLTVKAKVTDLNLTMLLDDTHRSQMYGLHEDANLTGSVVVIDPVPGTILRAISVGKTPTDMALSKDGAELYVINRVEKTISVINLATLQLSETMRLSFDSTAPGFGSRPKISVGTQDRVYYTDTRFDFYVLSRQQRSTRQVSYMSNFRYHDFVINASNSRVFGWGGSTQTNGGEHYFGYSVFDDFGQTVDGVGSYPEVPLPGSYAESPALLTGDGKALFARTLRVGTGDLKQVECVFPENVYSISPGGEIAVTERGIYGGTDAVKLADLPVASRVHAVTTDYARLVYFDPVTKVIGKLDLGALVGNAALGRTLSPAEGASVMMPEKLSWSSPVGAEGYQVYLGTSAEEVAAATLDSASFLGESALPEMEAPSDLVAGPTYFWRVDTVLNGAVVKGEVHSFTLLIAAHVREVAVLTLEGPTDLRVPLHLSSTAPVESWSATAEDAWITFTQTSGQTPDTLELRVNAADLPVGVHTSGVHIHSGGQVLPVPVTLTVEPLNVSILQADPQSSLVYGVSENEVWIGNSKSHLFEMDAATGKILKVVRVGDSIGGLAIHSAEQRLYLTNRKDNKMEALDKATLAPVRSYALASGSFSDFDALGDIWAGQAGRVIVRTQSIADGTLLFDTALGRVVSRVGETRAGMAADPTGRFIYAPSLINVLLKMNVAGERFTTVASYRSTSSQGRSVVVTQDGNGIFWDGKYLDKDLKVKASTDEMIFAASGDGRLAFGKNWIYDTNRLWTPLASMPVVTEVMVYNDAAQMLVVQKGRQMRSFLITPPYTLNPPMLTGAVSTESTSLRVSWSDGTLANSYALQYRRTGDTAWVSLESPSLAARSSSAVIPSLLPDTSYEIRLRGVSPVMGNSTWSPIITGRTIAAGPPAIALSSVLPGRGPSLELAFTGTHSPTSIVIERALAEAGPWSEIARVNGASASYRDTKVNVTVAYFYRVTAVRGAERAVSAPIRAVLAAPVLTLSSVEVGSWNVKLLAVNSNPVFSTVLQRHVVPDGAWVNVTEMAAPQASYTDAAVVPNTTYAYRLKAQQVSLTDAISNTVTVVTTAPSAPPTPQAFRIAEISATQVRLAWADGPSETGYRLERALASDMVWQQVGGVLPAGSTAYSDAAVVSGTGYYYRLSAVNDLGVSDSAVSALATPQALVTVFEDDFDPDIDAALWTSTSVTTSTNLGAGFNGSKALYFIEGGHAQTRVLDTQAGGWLEFSIRAGNGGRDGVHWKNSGAGVRIVLEASVNGTEWTILETFDVAFPALSDWADYGISLPAAAQAATTQLRWRHEGASSASGPWALDNVRVRAVRDDNLWITQPPVSKLVVRGNAASLSVSVAQPEATFQWYKNEVVIAGATQATYDLAVTQPSDGAQYTCVIRRHNAVLTTEPVYLGVVDAQGLNTTQQAPLEGSFNLQLDIHPAELTGALNYQWRSEAEHEMSYPGVIVRQDERLELAYAEHSAAGDYYCKVTYLDAEPVEIGPFKVEILSRPYISPLPAQTVPVGSWVDLSLKITDPNAVVKVSGLPKGISYDAKTRRITGRSLAAEKTYRVKVDASNAAGKADTMEFSLQIKYFEMYFIGAYRAVFLELPSPYTHGGQISCQVTTKGSVSGTFILGGKSQRFVSFLQVDPAGLWANFEVAIKDQDGQARVIGMQMDPRRGVTLAYLGTREGEAFEYLGTGVAVINAWSTKFPPRYMGLINAALLADEGESTPEQERPQGSGFLNLNVSPSGIATVKGRLADGQVVLGSTVVGLGMDMPIFFNLYRGTGSLAAVANYREGRLTGPATWGKDAQPTKSKDRLYKEGFARHTLTMDGAPYKRPSADYSPLPPVPGEDYPGQLKFTEGGLEAGSITYPFNLRVRNLKVVPDTSLPNPHKVTLKLNPATGLFNGTFKLADENPAKPGQMLRRPGTFYGCIVPSRYLGIGYFLLPDLPEGKVKQTPIRSGKVQMLPELP